MIRAKQNLTGDLNNAIERVYPELEDITIIPTEEEQILKSEKYGYENVKVKKIPDEYVVPTGNVEITSNGTYDVREKENVVVNIPEKQLGTKTITTNGIYNATDDNLDGYSSVDVQTSGVDINDYFVDKITSFLPGPSNLKFMYSILKKMPNVDVSEITSFYGAFAQQPAEIPLPTVLDTSNSTSFSYMFQNYHGDIPYENLNTQKGNNFSYMFASTQFPNFVVPKMDTSNGTNASNMFNGSFCKSIPKLNFQNITNVSNMFSNNVYLTDLGGFENLGKSYSKSQSSNYYNYQLSLSSANAKLTHESLMNIINNLYDIASIGVNPQKLVLGSTNIAKLTEEEIAIAQNKGWNVS